MSEYTIGRQKKSLEVYFTLVVGLASLVTYTKSSEARKCGNTNRASNHNVTEAYTMAGTQHTQTHPKYQYRFMALLRADMTAAPCRLTIEATSEREARQRLAGRYVLSFAGCIPAQEVRHV
ncbi:host cell division inhibitor Icd-like protein [Enterobacter roggenkampii]|uniref:host cell division inhibitor Icd-like protein n=1 Tax=Enterobacter roggenkampii TaxID=1812935 RepID=UPI003BDB441B